MDLSASLGDITLLRRTARAGSPMGSFSAVYTVRDSSSPRVARRERASSSAWGRRPDLLYRRVPSIPSTTPWTAPRAAWT